MADPQSPDEARALAEAIDRKVSALGLWPVFEPNGPGEDNPQLLFLASPAKFRCFNGGFRAGKTFVGAHEAWRTMREHPGSSGKIVAPSFPALRDYSQKTFFEIVGCDAETIEAHPLVASFNKTEQHLKLLNGSEVYFRSADRPGTLIGSTDDWFWLDEPASCAAVTWKNLIGRLSGFVGPRRGWCTGTPAGFNWVYREFAEAKRDDYFLVTGSSLQNTCLTDDYTDTLLDSYQGAFARANIYGEFVAFEGQVYQFNRALHVLPEEWTPDPDVAFDRTADFGTNNPTAWLWVQEIAGTVYIFDELEVRRQPVPVIAAEVNSRWKGLRHGGDFGDIAGTQRDSNLRSYVSNYAMAGIEIRSRAGGAVKAGVEVITRYLNPSETGVPRLLVHPRCVRLMAAFETYHWPEDKDGNPVGDEPEKDGVSDHLLDAARYWWVNRHPEQFHREVRVAGPVGTSVRKQDEHAVLTVASQPSWVRPGTSRRLGRR